MDLYGCNQNSGKIASEKWRFGNLFLNASIFGQKAHIIEGFQRAWEMPRAWKLMELARLDYPLRLFVGSLCRKLCRNTPLPLQNSTKFATKAADKVDFETGSS